MAAHHPAKNAYNKTSSQPSPTRPQSNPRTPYPNSALHVTSLISLQLHSSSFILSLGIALLLLASLLSPTLLARLHSIPRLVTWSLVPEVAHSQTTGSIRRTAAAAAAAAHVQDTPRTIAWLVDKVLLRRRLVRTIGSKALAAVVRIGSVWVSGAECPSSVGAQVLRAPGAVGGLLIEIPCHGNGRPTNKTGGFVGVA